MIKELWRDPVWSKVIAGVILAALLAAGSYLLNWWPAIGSLLGTALVFLLSTSSLPNWLIGLLVVLSALPILAVAASAWRGFVPSATLHDWSTYQTDCFFGLRWRWSYYSDGQIRDMHSFCPGCDYQVFSHHASGYRAVDLIAFTCDSCGRSLGEFQEPYESLESKVIRLIQQKLRNGTWRISQESAGGGRNEAR